MKRSVTVIDDDIDLRNLLQMALTSEGYEVATYASGDDFLTEMEEVNPSDIYVIDINLGGTPGFEVARQIKCGSYTKHGYVILISANPEVQQHAEEGYADSYMLKPFSQRELILRLKEIPG